MHWEDPFSTGCKLNLSHVVIGTADTIPSIRRHLIIQHRTAIAAQFNGTAGAVRMKTVTQQSNHHVGVAIAPYALRLHRHNHPKWSRQRLDAKEALQACSR